MYVYQPLNKELSLNEIADTLELKIEAQESDTLPANNLCSLHEPKSGGVAFFSDESLKDDVSKSLSSTGVAALIVPENFTAPSAEWRIPLFRSKNPQGDFLKLIPLFFEPRGPATGEIHTTAIIPDSCTVDERVDIGPYVVLGERVRIGAGTIIHPHVTIYNDVVVGENCTIHANATLREGTTIGENCSLQPGAVLGADGFGYIPDPTHGIAPVPQIGKVEIGNRVDLGALACVDRATIGKTEIKDNTKLDNLVQIGHNVKIGSHSLLCAQSGVGGSAVIGNQVTLGGHSGVADHIKIADNIRVGGKGGVVQDLTEKGDYLGMPAISALQWKRQQTAVQKLAKVLKKIIRLVD